MGSNENNPPTAPPSDSFYPVLDKNDPSYQEPPPPYNIGMFTDAPGQTPPMGTPQGPPQGYHPQPVVPPPSVNTPKNNVSNNVVTPIHPQPVPVIVKSPLADGVCHICRRGKIKDSATCCSWAACFFLLPFGIIPGLIAFCYLCRKPKCTRCGFIHGRGK